MPLLAKLLHGDPFHELRLVRYASGNFGKNLVWSTADITLLFILTDLIGLPTTSAALLMTFAFAGDLIFDILAGAISTQVKAFSGGTRKLITFAAIPCGVAFMLLYALPWWGEHRLWAITSVVLVFRAGFAVVDLPHYSMIASMTSDSRARGRTAGYRSFFSNISSLIVAMLVVPLVEKSVRLGDAAALAAFGACAGFLYCVVMAIAAITGNLVPPSSRSHEKATSLRLSIPRLPPLFVVLLPIAAVMGFAVPMFSRTAIYYSTYVLNRPAFASQILAAITIGQFGGVVVWTSLVRHFDKTKLLIASLAATLSALCIFAASAPNQIAMLISAALMGIALLGVYMLPWGILPDVVDFCELQQGFRQETTLFAMFLVVHKASGAASSGLIGWVLATTGYVPGGQQTRLVISAIVFLAFGIPIVGALLGIATLLPLKIGHRRHAAAVRKLAFRRALLIVEASTDRS
jgi:GPH family glycoside/pentoside/hexuronide:cation symporter